MARAGIEPGVAPRMYLGLATGIVELLAPGAATLEPALARALEETPGPIVVFASHTANWELAAGAAAAWLAARGRALHVVAKTQSQRGVDAYLGRLRARLGVRVLRPRGALAAARQALATGGVVAMPIDQVPDRAEHGAPLPFLGETALVDRAPATLARRAGATVLVVASERTPEGTVVRLLGALPPGRTRAWTVDVTRRATALLDAFVRAHPEGWLWLHRRWRKTPLLARESSRSMEGAR